MRALIRHIADWFVGTIETGYTSGIESCDYVRRLRAVPRDGAEQLDRAA